MKRAVSLWGVVVGLLVFTSSGVAGASSYQQLDGTIVSPIQSVYGGDLGLGQCLELPSFLSGMCTIPDLSPGVDVTTIVSGLIAELSNADLKNAALSGSNLTEAFLGGADLRGADLTGSILPGSGWRSMMLSGFGVSMGVPIYDSATDFTGAQPSTAAGLTGGFDPAVEGWTFIPEPSTALLLGIGLAGLGMRRRTRRGC